MVANMLTNLEVAKVVYVIFEDHMKEARRALKRKDAWAGLYHHGALMGICDVCLCCPNEQFRAIGRDLLLKIKTELEGALLMHVQAQKGGD